LAGGSILEVFGILFESNADDIKKGTAEAEKSVDDLDDSIDTSTESTKKLGKSFDVTASSARLLMGTAAVMGTAFVTMASQAANMLAEGRLSANLGQDIEKFHAMGAAIQELTGNADDYGQSLLGIREKLMAVQMGDSGAQTAFLKLGIQTVDASGRVRDPADIFEEVVDAVNTSKYPQLAMAWARETGMVGTVAAAAQTIDASGIEQLAKERTNIYSVSPEDVQRAKDLDKALKRATDSVSRIVQEFSKQLLPMITDTINAFTFLVMSNIDVIKTAASEVKTFIETVQSNIQLFLENPLEFTMKAAEGMESIKEDVGDKVEEVTPGLVDTGVDVIDSGKEAAGRWFRSFMTSMKGSADKADQEMVEYWARKREKAVSDADQDVPRETNVFDLMKFAEEQARIAESHPANSITPESANNASNDGESGNNTLRIDAPITIKIDATGKDEKAIANEAADAFSRHINRLGNEFSTNIAG
jgi:hypothetical protein